MFSGASFLLTKEELYQGAARTAFAQKSGLETCSCQPGPDHPIALILAPVKKGAFTDRQQQR
jgi:hypothetical protein